MKIESSSNSVTIQIEHDGMIYQFISHTTISENHGTNGPLFREIPNGFKQHTDSGILTVQPKRLQFVETNRSGTFRSFLPRNLESHTKTIVPEDLAIMNQTGLFEHIESGKWIKTLG